jgi:hypothetical protein
MNRLNRVTMGFAAVLVAMLVASCSSAAQGPTIEIRDGPGTVEAGEGSFSIALTNLASAPQEFVVLTLTAGDADSLPMRNGVIDLRRDQPFSDPRAPDYANFDVVYPDYERLSPGTYVVVSHEPGGYEAGKYAAFIVSGG